MENRIWWNTREYKCLDEALGILSWDAPKIVAEAERRGQVDALEEARTRLVTEMNDRGDIAAHFAMNWFNAKINELKGV